MNQEALSSFIWSVADLLRGDYKQSEYGKVILPFTVLRRLIASSTTPKPPSSPNSPLNGSRNSHPNRSCSAKPGRVSTTHRPST
jgi:type I restriction enzyme M protein